MAAPYLAWIVSRDGFCYLPLILFFGIGMLDADDKENTYKNAIFLGISFAMMALISASVSLIIDAAFFDFMCLFKLFEMFQNKDFSKLKRYLGSVAMAAGIAILLSLETLLGTITFLPQMGRYVDGGVGYLFSGKSIGYSAFSGQTNDIVSLQRFFEGNSYYNYIAIALVGLVFLWYGGGSKNKGYK